MYLQFLPFFRADMTQVVEIISCGHLKQDATHFSYSVSSDHGTCCPDLTQGAKASATMILILLNPDNSVPSHQKLSVLTI